LAANPYQAREYLKTKVQTASKEQIILMLFDGVLRFCEQGKTAIIAKEIENSHNALVRAQAIILELVYALNHKEGGEIAGNLAQLYSYSLQQLIQANMLKETEPIDVVQHIFRDIREGWLVAMEQVMSENAAKTEEHVDIQQSDNIMPNSSENVMIDIDNTAKQPSAPVRIQPAATKKAIAPPPQDTPRLSIMG